MEGIVFGIAQINFRQSLGKVSDEKSSTDRVQLFSTNMTSENLLPKSEQVILNCSQENSQPWLNSGENSLDGHDSQQECADDIDSDWSRSKNRCRKSCTFTDVRKLPSRASKETSMLGIKRRTIMKPTKRKQAIHKDFNNLKPADVKKLYLNKKITNFRPSSLETIFEEPSTTQNDLDEREQVQLIGARKIKRSLFCSNGLKHNKTLVNKRRAKIKKTFGRRFALKKISLEEFLDKLNSSMEENEASSNLCEQSSMDKDSSDHQASSFGSSDHQGSSFGSSMSTNGASTAADALVPTSLLL